MKRKIFSILFALVLVLSLSLIPSASVGASPGPGLVGLWHLDEGSGTTAYDSSGSGNDGTLSGGRFGGALSFDGTNDYVNVPHDTTLNPTSAITVEAWAKLDRVDVHQVLVRKMNTYSLQVTVGLNGAGARLEGWVMIGGAWKGVRGVAGGTLLGSNQWYHFAFTYDGAQVITYVNGVADRSNGVTGAIDSTTYPLNIGRCGPPEQSYCYADGIIDEVRISNVARTSFVLTAPPSADDDTVALWHFDESVGLTAYDETANNNDGTIHGASRVPAGPTWTTGTSAAFGNALSFDGTDDYVDFGQKFRFGTGESFTAECWIKTAVKPSDRTEVMGIYAGPTYPTPNQFWAIFLEKTGKVSFWLRVSNGAADTTVWGTTVVTDGGWHHIAAVKDVTNNKMRLFVDGSMEGGEVSFIDGPTSNNYPFRVGDGCWNRYYKGVIDEVRIWDVALSSGEIQESCSLGEAGNNANYDTIVSHEAGSSVFIFTSAFHDVDDDDIIAFRLMRVGSTETIDTGVSYNGTSIRRVTPKGSTWELDSVAIGDPAATESDIDPGTPDGPRPHQTLHLDANLTGGLEPLGFNLHTKGL